MIEISANNGASWTDIGAFASPGYNHTLETGGGNVLGGRLTYSGLNTSYPLFNSVTVNLGTAFAGQTVRIRFREGTDNAVGLPGWEIDDIVLSGITNSPFTAVVPFVGCPTQTSVTSSQNPSPGATSVTFTATVLGGVTTPTGTVTFKDGTTVLGSAPLNGGAQAVFSTSTLLPGTHSISAEYGGDGAHAASISSPLSQGVQNFPSMTTLGSNQNPSAFGQPVTLTATVSGFAGVATGAITFKEGTAVLGAVNLNVSGMASLILSTLAVGPHSIIAEYSGDGTYSASVSLPLVQTVNLAASAVAVSSNHNPSTQGDSINFTATVSAVAPGSGIPTGSVSFFNGSVPLGSVPLTSGSAMLSIGTLKGGAHNITAVYSGDASFNGATSAVLSQIVKAKGRTQVTSH